MKPTYDAPARVQIAITSNLTGVAVEIGEGPSARDPMAQGRVHCAFADFEEARHALPGLVGEFVERCCCDSPPGQG